MLYSRRISTTSVFLSLYNERFENHSISPSDFAACFQAAETGGRGLRDAIKQMFELMYAAKGVGLAANQVDLPYRFFIVNQQGDPVKVKKWFSSIRC